MVNYKELISGLSETNEPLGLLTMQATSTTSRIFAALPGRLKALYSAEHGFFGTAAPGEHTASGIRSGTSRSTPCTASTASRRRRCSKASGA